MKEKTDILFGYHSVYEAMKADRRKHFSLMLSQKRSSGRTEKIESLARQKKIPIQTVKPGLLDKTTQGGLHQGIVLETSDFPIKKATDVIAKLKNRDDPAFILILENIEDPHNLGALIRTALCSGVDYILVPKDRSCHPTPTVSRSSAGAMEHADIYLITNTASIIRDFKKNGVWVSGLDAAGTTRLYEADLTGDIALVIGGEHKGIRPLVKKECDFLLSIPNKGRVNSLNASVAGGIAMYEALRQRS